MGVSLKVAGPRIGTTLKKTKFFACSIPLLMCLEVFAKVEVIICVIILKMLLLLVVIIWHEKLNPW